MVQQNRAAVCIFAAIFIISLLSYNYQKNMIRVDDKIYLLPRIRDPIYIYNGTEDFLINTAGCYIPNYGKKLKYKEAKDRKQSCGERAIFVKRINSSTIIFDIDKNKMKQYIGENDKYECCYRFAMRSRTDGEEDNRLSYTKCEQFKNGSMTALSEEVIEVSCIASPKNPIYNDVYIILKKQLSIKRQTKEKAYNVLLLGMDTMSRARAFNSMPKTVKYLQTNGWLDYKGYQKVGYNTFPNLMAVLTGMKMTSIYKECHPTMSACNDLMLWSTFRKAGYITAYGEDYIKLPDTFYRYNGFKSTPTHHYMRPFFLTGESQKENLICTKTQSSGKHTLDYAYDLATSYKNESFFGIFWINSYSHNSNNLPTLFENDIIDLFEKANATGITDNTFIILFSDHGIRNGAMRIPTESYYDERLPMFFLWVPNSFRKQHKEEFYNLRINQNRLVTPYDFYLTLVKISNMTALDIISKACPSCQTIFKKIPTHRTCKDAGVSEKWCSCHQMKTVDRKNNIDADKSLEIATSYVSDKIKKTKTIDCMVCQSLHLDKVFRIHSYVYGNKTYYVVAFQMNPGKIGYEATVVKEENELSLVNGIDTLTVYNTRGNCVKNPNERMYCVCKMVKCSKVVGGS